MREDELVITVDFELSDEVPGLDIGLAVTTSRGVKVFDEALSDHELPRLGPGAYRADMSVPPILNVGDHTVGLWMGTMLEDFLYEPAAASFTLGGSGHDRPDRAVVLGLPFVVRPAVPGAPLAESISAGGDDD
jgi:ABC-2 type transport system ATP-binding protein/lipopolysaccharide transport system ATP-binding protein